MADKLIDVVRKLRELSPLYEMAKEGIDLSKVEWAPEIKGRVSGRSKWHIRIKVLDHYNNPRNVGSLDKSAENVGTGMVGAPECGDVMKLQIRVDDASGIIEEAKFKDLRLAGAAPSRVRRSLPNG